MLTRGDRPILFGAAIVLARKTGSLPLMTPSLTTFTSDGHVVISFPESAVPAEEREDFIAFLKAEWMARQSRFSEADAKSLADVVDSGWWSRNRERILRSIGEA